MIPAPNPFPAAAGMAVGLLRECLPRIEDSGHNIGCGGEVIRTSQTRQPCDCGYDDLMSRLSAFLKAHGGTQQTTQPGEEK